MWRHCIERWVTAGLALSALGVSAAVSPNRLGVDANLPAIEAAHMWATAPAQPAIAPGTWLRLRETGLQFLGRTEAGWGIVNPGQHAATLDALRQLRTRGFRLMALVELSHHDWPGGMHVASGVRMAADLREVAGFARALPAAYAGLIDAWEVENEPDLGFVSALPENYAAYLKAFWHGFKAGEREAGAAQSTPVLMGALGLPPGPWLERFAANDGPAYTDGFSYHYYGYAEDFAGVYRQHEAAMRELSTCSPGSAAAKTKPLPVFMTEAGYGLLGVNASAGKEGRLRQWRWFSSIGEHTRQLRLAAANAFMLKPYSANAASEFGLTQPAGAPVYAPEDFGATGATGWPRDIGVALGENLVTPALAWWLDAGRNGSDVSAAWLLSLPAVSPVTIDFLAGVGLQTVKRYNGSFVIGLPPEGTPAPPAKGPESYPQPPGMEMMIHVRTKNGNLYEVYPTRNAAAGWQEYFEPAENFTLSFFGRAELPWRFADNQPVALVVVMYPRQMPAMLELSRARLVRVEPLPAVTGKQARGTLVLYNFSSQPVAGRLVLPVGMKGDGAGQLVLSPGERREVAVCVEMPEAATAAVVAEVRFEPDDAKSPAARFQTRFLPDLAGRRKAVVGELFLPENSVRVSNGNHLMVNERKRAGEEVAMRETDGVFAQPGTKVECTADGLRITVSFVPDGQGRRTEVEIPWPDGLMFGPGEYLSVEFRQPPE